MAKSNCICTSRFFFGGCFGALCTLWLLSESGSFADVVDLDFFLNKENTGRRFCWAGGELCGVGDDGGLDRSGSSEKIADVFFGLEEGGAEASHGIEEHFTGEELAGAVDTSISVLLSVCSTRLRFVGGDSSYNGRFFCRE